MTMIEEITTAVLLNMKVNSIEDNPQNRLKALIDLRNTWIRNAKESTEKNFYVVSINCEILDIQIHLEKVS